MATKKNIQSACLIIIGNEILSGRTQDKNINHIAKELFLCGVSLQLVIVIPDSKKIIISQIRKLKTESISLAVRKKYKLHKGAFSELKKYYRKVRNNIIRKFGKIL